MKVTKKDVDCKKNNFLYVHQEKWQQDLMIRYGSNISLMDATYKTTKYNLPLFFVCVLTNSGYQIVGKSNLCTHRYRKRNWRGGKALCFSICLSFSADFVVQNEDGPSIYEALKILREWNPLWNPPFFVTDFDFKEINAIESCKF